jgi:hypothetical protein
MNRSRMICGTYKVKEKKMKKLLGLILCMCLGCTSPEIPYGLKTEITGLEAEKIIMQFEGPSSERTPTNIKWTKPNRYIEIGLLGGKVWSIEILYPDKNSDMFGKLCADRPGWETESFEKNNCVCRSTKLFSSVRKNITHLDNGWTMEMYSSYSK